MVYFSSSDGSLFSCLAYTRSDSSVRDSHAKPAISRMMIFSATRTFGSSPSRPDGKPPLAATASLPKGECRTAPSFALALPLRLPLSLPALPEPLQLHPSGLQSQRSSRATTHTSTSVTFTSRTPQVISRSPLANFRYKKFNHLHSQRSLCPEHLQHGD